MKITAEEYLKKTESEIKKLFKEIKECNEELINKGYIITFGREEERIKLANWINKNNRELFDEVKSKKALEKLCANVLKIAEDAINSYSTITIIEYKTPEEIKKSINAFQENIVKYCTGRQKFELPIGLIIYAANNDNEISSAVFDHLRNLDDEFDDLSLESYVITVLEWRSYSDYEKDMLILLNLF